MHMHKAWNAGAQDKTGSKPNPVSAGLFMG
jgi:hypothetical protein